MSDTCPRENTTIFIHFSLVAPRRLILSGPAQFKTIAHRRNRLPIDAHADKGQRGSRQDGDLVQPIEMFRNRTHHARLCSSTKSAVSSASRTPCWTAKTTLMDHSEVMAFPTKTCVFCSEEFELKPDKPGFANRCPTCSSPESEDALKSPAGTVDREANAARREAMRNLLYRKDS